MKEKQMTTYETLTYYNTHARFFAQSTRGVDFTVIQSILHYSEDLGVISMNHALFSQMEEDDFRRVEEQMREDLRNYYNNLKM